MNLDRLLSIQADKAQHFIWGEIVAYVAMLAQALLTSRYPVLAFIDKRVTAVAAAAIVGTLKEYAYDKFTGGDVSNADILATAAGGVAVAGAMTVTP